MAGNVRVVLKSVWDDSGIKQAQKAFDKIGAGVDKAFNVVAVASAAAGAAIGAFAKSSIDAASDLQESTNAVNVAFGQAAESVLAIGENSAESFGLATDEFNAAAVRFSAFAERIVGAGGDVSGFIGDVTQRAADFASVFNIEVAEALRVFQSGLAGEAEPLKRFGINLLESEVKAYALRAGIIAVGETMDETQKVQARYGLLMESTNKTAGDFANTSDGLANSQRILKAEFTNLQAEVGEALLPAVTDLFRAFSDQLLPKMEELGQFLKSPQGQKAIEDVAKSVKEFFTFIFDNIDTIVDMTAKIAGFIVVMKSLKIAIEAAKTVQLLFNVAVAANPYVLAAIALGALITAVVLFGNKSSEARVKYEALRDATEDGQYAERGLADAYRESSWAADRYGIETDDLREAQRVLAAQSGDTAGEINRFNNLSLAGLRSELQATADVQATLNNQAREYGLARMGLLTGTPSGRGVTATTTTATTTPSGPSRAERQRSLIDDMNEQIDNALSSYNKTVANAREAYADQIADLEKRYAEAIANATTTRDESLAKAALAHAANISQIQKDFADKQAAIIQQSIDRLRDAYRSAVETNVVDLFGTEQVGKSVDSLVTSLRDKLNASRTLLENSAQLASQGFSQTFIEQVVGAGTETGNELASAILDATPETQAELQDLFRALEVESTSGMDTLAQTMYEKTGLATDELKALYTQTNEDLVAALAQAEQDYADTQQNILDTFQEAMQEAMETRKDAFATANEQLNDALADAATALNEQLASIQKDFEKRIADMGGAVAALRSEIDALYARLSSPLSVGTPTVTAPTIPSTQTVPTTTRTAPTTVVNVEVKTDQTQSPAQVGQVISRTINKYAGTGGGGGGAIRYVAF